MNLIIDEENCIGCGLCESVCIRENIKVDDICIELDSWFMSLIVVIVWQYVLKMQ